MPLGFDDILAAFAAKAAQAFGEKLADDFFNFLTHDITTKEDLEKLAIQLEQFVHQEFTTLELDTFLVNLAATTEALREYYNSDKDEDFLKQANASLLNATAWFEMNLKKTGPDFLRVQLVPLISLIGADLTTWLALALIDSSNKKTLAEHIQELWIPYLQTAMSQIELMETESQPVIEYDSRVDVLPAPPNTGGEGKKTTIYWATIEMTRQLYAGGKLVIAVGEDPHSKVIAEATQIAAEQKARIDMQNEYREHTLMPQFRALIQALEGLAQQ